MNRRSTLYNKPRTDRAHAMTTIQTIEEFTRFYGGGLQYKNTFIGLRDLNGSGKKHKEFLASEAEKIYRKHFPGALTDEETCYIIWNIITKSLTIMAHVSQKKPKKNFDLDSWS